MSTVYNAFLELLKTTSEINSLIGKLKDTAPYIYCIFGGEIPKGAKVLPALCFTGADSDILPSTLKEQNYTLNVYAETEEVSESIRDIIKDYLDDNSCTVLGVVMRFRVTGSVNVPNPTETEVNSPLTVRITYRGN